MSRTTIFSPAELTMGQKVSFVTSVTCPTVAVGPTVSKLDLTVKTQPLLFTSSLKYSENLLLELELKSLDEEEIENESLATEEGTKECNGELGKKEGEERTEVVGEIEKWIRDIVQRRGLFLNCFERKWKFWWRFQGLAERTVTNDEQEQTETNDGCDEWMTKITLWFFGKTV